MFLQADRDTSPGVVAELRSKRQTLNLMNQICSKSTQCEKSTMKTQFGIRDSPNPLLQLPIDLHRFVNF